MKKCESSLHIGVHDTHPVPCFDGKLRCFNCIHIKKQFEKQNELLKIKLNEQKKCKCNNVLSINAVRLTMKDDEIFCSKCQGFVYRIK